MSKKTLKKTNMDYKVLFAHPGAVLRKTKLSDKDAIGMTGELSLCKFLKGAFFFLWTSEMAEPTYKPKFTIYVYFQNLKAIECTQDMLSLMEKNNRIHHQYSFQQGLSDSVVRFLERNEFIRKGTTKESLYDCLANPRGPFSETDLSLPLAIGQYREVDYQTLAPRSNVCRGDPLNREQWDKLKGYEGSIPNPNNVKTIIFKGGIIGELRAELWKYLLGMRKWEFTRSLNSDRKKSKNEKYCQLKRLWTSFTPDQVTRFTGLQERQREIREDLEKMDKTHEFFSKDENVEVMQHILLTHVMYDFDLGYIRGMSELLAPIFLVVQDEVAAFWCFSKFMRKISDHFNCEKTEMQRQLEQLQTLLSFVNEELYQHLKDQASENMVFCYKWLHLWFIEVFSYSDIALIWEVLWTELPCPNYQLFICAAILDQAPDEFINFQVTKGLRVQNNDCLPVKLNVQTVLEQAESMYQQVKTTLESPKSRYPKLRQIIGM